MRLTNIHIAPLEVGKKVFFASDFHLAHEPHELMRKREEKIITWLHTIRPSAQAIFLLGDIFNFWFEYKHVVPKGMVRFQACIACLVEEGIAIYLVPGNHDMWLGEYFTKELGITVLPSLSSLWVGSHRICLGHGDEEAGSLYYKYAKTYFYHSSTFKWLAAHLPVDLFFGMSSYCMNARKRRYKRRMRQSIDPIFTFCKDKIQPGQHHDYYIFGHLHQPSKRLVTPSSTYYNVGDWVHHHTYLICDEEGCTLSTFPDEKAD